MASTDHVAAVDWDLTVSQLRGAIPRAIGHLQALAEVVQTCYHSSEMGPEEWSEQSADLESFLVPGRLEGPSAEEAVSEVFRLVRGALQAGDLLGTWEGF